MSANCFVHLHDEIAAAVRGRPAGPPYNGVGEHAWMIQGSGAMKLQGIPVEPDDIDVFVKPWLYGELKSRGWTELWPREGDPPMLEWGACRLPVHAWYDWDDRWPEPEPLKQAFENIVPARFMGRTFPVMSLPLIVYWKGLIRRPKDVAHIELIHAYAETEVFGTGG